ncbi:zinc transporter ZIP13 isoform X1 [Rhineura floridana]|uniref:zinc transporter ZIP13 isoform X1 n=1 Tax=Rhineura floridana TaxID=261503 RepID=UPI002AC84E48|nr:zinc transporter ZIP13 isoform X1 [Rhineura floridana]XP_061466972.1 zinc transporter ZIP13 isoform X1 [Rhineura floridana]XP_061466973.1 zinc transporter ZIP13 isoform X1 [Rhineura floridana]
MMGGRLFLHGTLSFLLLIVACQAHELPLSQAANGAIPLCEKEAESWGSIFNEERLDAWICSLIGSVMVGLSGVLPLLVIPLKTGAALKLEEGSHRMKQLLSFAIGGLLGNVFLHLLPEAWAYTCSATAGGGQSFQQQKLLGLWVIIGLLTFLSLQKMFPDSEKQGNSSLVSDSKAPAKRIPNGSSFSGQKTANPVQRRKVGTAQCNGSSHLPSPPARKIKISGYLNLLANTIDNFTHGLAVAASFLVSRKVGLLTTIAILLHEIPHEVGDFVILLRAGFDRWSAAKLQLSTALGGVLGASFAICAQSPKGTGETIAWILPFTSGGFLYIALVNVVPDLLEEKNPWNSVQQVLLLCTGIIVMVLLSLITE